MTIAAAALPLVLLIQSLQSDPQQGATPRPIEPTPAEITDPARTDPVTTDPVVPERTDPEVTRELPPVSPVGPAERLRIDGGPQTDILRAPPGQETPLPPPVRDPLAIDASNDPILAMMHLHSDAEEFRRVVAAAIANHPATEEALAQTDEARAEQAYAEAGRYPVADVSFTYFNTIARGFSNDPDNLLERSRPRSRADGLLRVQQPLLDFGSTSNRVAAEKDRVAAAEYGESEIGTEIALRAVGAWNNVFGYRALVRLGNAFGATQDSLRALVQQRIDQGVSAQGDIAQVESYIASAEAQQADFERALANAEANYIELTGLKPPAELGLVPMLAPESTLDETECAAERIPSVLAAQKQADAATRDRRAASADLMPRVTAGVDAGRYGFLDNSRDYDVRANLSLTTRIGGAGPALVNAAEAREQGSAATYNRVRNQAVRDARIAWSDLQSLRSAAEAIEVNYLASRRSRDVLVERFRVSRGTLIDVLSAQNNFFQVAARYVQVMTELGTARYTLLARSGLLLDEIDVPPSGEIER